MGPLEQEISVLLKSSVRGTALDLAARVEGEAAIAPTFQAMTPDQRDHFIMLSLAGAANAIRRIARHIDEADRTTIDNRPHESIVLEETKENQDASR